MGGTVTLSGRWEEDDANDVGLIGDGVTDNAEALQALMDTGGVVRIPEGVYLSGAMLSATRPVTLLGDPGAVFAFTDDVVVGINVTTDDVAIRGLSFSGDNTYLTVAFQGPYRGGVVSRCQFDRGPTAVYVTGGFQEVDIIDSRFRSLSAVWLDKATGRVQVARNDIANWGKQRPAVYVLGVDDNVSRDLDIVGNTFHSPDESVGAGQVAYPLHVASATTGGERHQGLKILDNTLYGTDKEFGIDTGTPDQISIFSANDVIVSGNISSDGGDMGIAVGDTVSRLLLTGNICTRNDVSGIFSDASDTVLVANVSNDNGQNRAVDPPGNNLAGITVGGLAKSTLLVGNLCSDGQDEKTQQYGVTIRDGAEEIQLGENFLSGNGVAPVNVESGP